MAVKIRKSKTKLCESCKGNSGKYYDIGIGPKKGDIQLVTLCDACMHQLLQKLIIVGTEQ